MRTYGDRSPFRVQQYIATRDVQGTRCTSAWGSNLRVMTEAGITVVTDSLCLKPGTVGVRDQE